MKIKRYVYGIIIISVLISVLKSETFSQTSPDIVKFAFISDIHIGKTDYQGRELYPALWLEKALYEIIKHNPDLIFIGGDIIENSNSSEQYDTFDSIMNTGIPYYAMPGNHDIGAQESALSRTINNWIKRGYGRGKNNREFYGFTFGSAAFYILNTQTFNSSDEKIINRSETQMAECDSFFAANMAIPVKVLLSHVPLFTKSADEQDNYFNIKIAYRKRILEMMKKYSVTYYVAGHQHVHNEVTQDGITIYMNTALSFQLGTGNRRGYYIYTSSNNELSRTFYPLD